MDEEEFVQHLHALSVNTAASVVGKLAGPGDEPEFVSRARWYKSLPDTDRRMVDSIVRFSTYAAIFDVLCEFDGVGDIPQNAEEGTLELRFVRKGTSVLLNAENEELHDLFEALNDEVFE